MSNSVDALVISANSGSVQQPSPVKVVEGDRGKPPTPAPTTGRRIRLNNNLISTIFQIPEPESANTPRTVKRCTYHRELNSHEDLFGGGGGQSHPEVRAENPTATVRCRITPTPNTQQNIFGGSDAIPRQVSSIRLASSAHADTFDSLFGSPELTQNSRRHYEEDTHCKLFGDPDPAVHRQQQAPQEDTQANLFGPPIASTHHVSSRTEDTQLDIFGPPLPRKVSTKKLDRSSLQLFTDEAEEPRKPIVQTRAEKINGASHEKLFGAPTAYPLIPRLPPDEDTTLRLFGPTIPKPPPSSEQKFNPITGEERAETTRSSSSDTSASSPPSPAAPVKPASAVFSPITGLTRDGCASPQQAEEKISRKRRIQPVNGTKVNTITGAELSYTPAEGEATQQDVVEEEKGEKKETMEAVTAVAAESASQTTVGEEKSSLEARAAQDLTAGRRASKKRGQRSANESSLDFVF